MRHPGTSGKKNKNKEMRAIVSIIATLVAAVTFGQSPQKMNFDIARQPVAEALTKLGKQSGLTIILASAVDTNAESPALVGDYTPDEALQRLLADTGLRAEYLDVKTVAIRKASDVESAPSPAPKSIGAASDRAQDPQQGSNEATRSDQGLDEIIVTAQKRSERLQDVPVPVTALDATILSERNQNRIQDYFASIPGLSFNEGGGGGGGQQSLAIRGITTGALTNPTVGITIDDTPYGSSTLLGFGSLVYPDIDPNDLERVEVLRGPQGTLYGASSLGGLVKFVTKDPSTTAFSGNIQMSGNDVEHGNFAYGVRAMVNIPLSESLAVRASAFTRRDPGYIDNILTGQKDVDRADVYGGRFAMLWRPYETVSLKLSALLQNTKGFGNPAVDTDNLNPVYGDLKQARMPGTEGYYSKVRLYTATVKASLPAFDFTSVTGYGDNKYSLISDDTAAYAQLFQVPGVSAPQFYETTKFTQEFRLSSVKGQVFDWLAGMFYTHESSPTDVALVSNNLLTGAPIGPIIDFNDPTTLSEYAIFGDFTVYFTSSFDVQFGGRESKDRQVYNETDSGPATPTFYGSPSPLVNPTEHTNGNAFTYLVTPRFKVSQDLMLYTRFTSGYRVGGDNVNAVIGAVPTSYAPDKTNNYEIGMKGDLLDRTLTFDLSAYYIAWKKVQIQLSNPATFSVYTANGGSAKSEGVELSLQARPRTGLRLTAALSVNDAELTQDLPPLSTAYGVAGARLPFSSRFSGNLGVDQDVALGGSWTGFGGASFAYVGAREGVFTGSAGQRRLKYPAYGELDLRVGARNDVWTVSLFLNNVADQRGIVGGGAVAGEGGPGQPGASDAAIYIQPRTVGVTIARGF